MKKSTYLLAGYRKLMPIVVKVKTSKKYKKCTHSKSPEKNVKL